MLADRRVLCGTLFCLVALTTAMPVWAGSWSTQTVLANNAYSGAIALDSAGNMVAVWNLDSGSVNQIQASTSAFGHPWSAPVNLTGTITGAGNPEVVSSASGNSTAVFTNNTTAEFADHPHGGTWGTPGNTNGTNQFFVGNDNGDQALAWGTGSARTANTIGVVSRRAGGAWSAAVALASGSHFAFDGAVVGPDGTMAVAWESYSATCGSRVCKTSNWVLHVSTLAHGATTWIDSGPLLGPDATQHFTQLAADGLADLGAIALQGSNIVSVVRHGSVWSGPAVIASTTAVLFNRGTGRDNRTFHSDMNGHASLVSWGPGLYTLVAVDGNLTTNTWGKVTTISGSDQSPGYFHYAMSESGAAIVFWWTSDLNSNTTWRAATRSGPGVAWNAPATVGTSFDAGGQPESVAINSAGQAAVIFHGYSSDFLTYIEYSNTYQP